MKPIHIYLPLLTVLSLGSVACNSEDAYFNEDFQKAPMQITRVYLEDYESAVPDRPVEFARLGQMLRLEGAGLYGVRRVEINGYETYFNRAYVTDNNLLITLNGDTPVSDGPEGVRNTVHLYKGGGNEYVFSFEIRAATPLFSHFSNTLPNPGEKVIVYGSNMQETSEILLPDGSKITEGIDSDRDGEWFSFTMPAGMNASGSIEAVNANGRIKSPACFNERGGIFLDFDDNGKMGSWSATYGSADLESDPLGTGRGNVAPLVPESTLADGPLQTGAKSLYWATAGRGDDPNDDWSKYFGLIPADTPVADVALQYDIYCPDLMTTGVIEFSLQNNLSNYGWNTAETKPDITEWCTYPTAYVWIPWYDKGEVKPYSTEGWTTVTVPFSNVGKYQDAAAAYTFNDVVNDRNNGSYSNFLMLLVNSDVKYNESTTLPAEAFSQKVYVDNWRIVPYKTYKVSDFPDEDEED